MGRNRKGRQCGGYESKMERFVLQRKWQYQVSNAIARAQQSRQVQQRRHALAEQENSDNSSSSSFKRRVRVDVVKALMNARLKDDHVERIKIKSAEHIATQLEQSSRVQHFTSLQDRCLYEIARTFDCYSSTCPFTEEFFGTFEPWMVTRLSELTTAFKTMIDGNVALLLQQPTEALTLGFVRDERALAPLFEQHESDRQRMAWQLNPLLGGGVALHQQVDSWDELDVDDVDIVATHDVVHLQTLELISCAGLTLQFVNKLTLEHPFIEHFKVIDCFDTLDSADGAALLHQVASWRSLKTLHFSWCCWLTTEMLVTLAYRLLEPRAPALEEFHVSDCFDVLEDYVRSLFAELHPQRKRRKPISAKPRPSQEEQEEQEELHAQTMSLSGPLYRRTPRLFNKNKPGDWTLVWCELPLEEGDGELIVYQEQHSRRKLVTIPVRDCDIAHVRSDGRDCIEITISKSKKETFSSHESSFDVDWWMNTLLSVKRDLELGIRPRAFIVCPPTLETPAPYKSIKRAPSSQNLNGGAAAPVTRPTLRRRQPTLTASVALFERFTIYETATTFYVVCSDRHYSRFRLLELSRTVDRPKSLNEILTEDTNLYSWKEMEEKLQLLTELAKNNGDGKLVRAFTAVAIVGCIRFLRDYYFIFVTQRRKIGCIGGNFVYGISATHQLSVSRPNQDGSAWTWLNRWFNPSPEEEAEARYLGLFHFIDLTKDFFFSYSYDITHTLQYNMTNERSEPSEMFTWNSYLTQELTEFLSPGASADLVVPIVLGSYEQRKCSVFGRLISVILLARRSRHFAGTRYLKRGVADTGKAANDVETEQIIEDENMGAGKLSSFVQYRGSIPVFWSQETSATLPKPPIVLNRVDPTYTATRKHFADLFARYGSPIVALNLVKQAEKKEREVLVGKEYLNAVEYLNSFMPLPHQIRYVALDYSRLSKQKTLDVYKSLDKFAVWALAQTGFFCSAPKRHVGKKANKRTAEVFPNTPKSNGSSANEIPPLESPGEFFRSTSDEHPISPTIPRKSGDWLEQKGVLRTNCIDCLDRTNVSQFAVGLRALGQQLYAMGIRNTPMLESSSQLVRVLTHLYSVVGDAISIQYGGSEAHKNVKNTTSRENFKHRELLTSIRRYYSNSFTDTAKQDAINIFLGHFVPKENQPPLWELENDYYLHNFEVRNGAVACEEMRKSLAWHLESRPHIKPYEDGASLSSPAETNSSNEYEFVEEIEEDVAAVRARDQERREAYIRECKKLLEDWWKEPLEKFERPKFALSRIRSRPTLEAPEETDSDDGDDMPRDVIEIGADTGNEESIAAELRAMQLAMCAPCSDEFIQMYHPEELTSFKKTLGYQFMNPLESHDMEKTRSESAGSESLVSASASTPTNGRGVHARSISTEEIFADTSAISRRYSIKYLGNSRSGRSMSAPDFGDEVDRLESHRRGRDSAHEGRTALDEDDYGVDNRGSIRSYVHGNGTPTHLLKGVLKRNDDVEDFGRIIRKRNFVGDCTAAAPDSIYETYVQSQQTPLMWENDNENVRMFFESYLRENNISADDARSLREAQVRGGATYKIQSGPYSGLDQNVKAREIIAIKGLKTNPDERKFYQDTLDYKKLVQTGKSSIPPESLELYQSFFDDELPDVSIYSSPRAGAKGKPNYVSFASSAIGSPPSSTSSSSVVVSSELPLAVAAFEDPAQQSSTGYQQKPRKIIGPRGVRIGNCDLVSVGALFKLDGGRDQDFILFNEAAAEHSFGEMMKNETELAYSK